MKAALITAGDRIAPLYDVASHALIARRDGDEVSDRILETLPENPGAARAVFFAQKGVKLVICGAISRPLYEAIAAYDVKVLPFVSGTVEEILRAWTAGTLESGAFQMPGCRRRGGGRRGGYFGGRGRRGFREKTGRGNARNAFPAMGFCVCAACGHREPHERGTPCTQKLCPCCGAVLMREKI